MTILGITAFVHSSSAALLADEKCPDIGKRCAALLAAGKIVGWFQGRMEYGPRVLGNRSILADPRQVGVKNVVNDRIKFRERFRPFAPSVIAEKAGEYFADTRPFPYMTVVLPVRPEKRSVIPAVTHADGTARLQTVEQATNPRFHRLLREFEALTGVPVLLNTSFNLQGEPIVCAPEDAVNTFLSGGLNALCLGDFLCEKKPS
jgi:carbamoyltransferase